MKKPTASKNKPVMAPKQGKPPGDTGVNKPMKKIKAERQRAKGGK